MVKHHAIKLHTPFYADRDDGTMLHRYLDEQFIPRFLQEAGSGQLGGVASQQWRLKDSFGRHAGGLPTLRLPLHRAFHVVSCEVSCDMPGEPAWDPARVLSAGFVVRRGSKARSQQWKLIDGVPQGWRKQDMRNTDLDDNELDPDEYRRLRQRGLIAERTPEPLFSGEQTHPLHTTVIEENLGEGRTRKRTLLYGFLPLGGSVEVPLRNEDQADDNAALPINGQLAEHEWPFGCWDGESGPEDMQDCTGDDPKSPCCAPNANWNQDVGLQVENGRPKRAMVQLLRTLIERYQLFNAADPSNEALRNLLGEIKFYDNVTTSTAANAPDDPNLAGLPTRGSLRGWLDARYSDFIDDMADWDEAVLEEERKNPASEPADLNLPPLPKLRGKGSRDLYITKEQAATLRNLLVMRAESAEQQLTDSLPIPRYGQAEDDVYFVRPFVRYCDNGRERIAWGPDSSAFRVVSPLDPEAVRPTSIQLPELDDVKRGLARGVTFITPKSLADQIEKIKPDLDFKKQGKGNLLGACASLSISFSIPIITICAMILLMIIINLLNIFLRWLPWAMIKLPSFCRGNN